MNDFNAVYAAVVFGNPSTSILVIKLHFGDLSKTTITIIPNHFSEKAIQQSRKECLGLNDVLCPEGITFKCFTEPLC